MTICLPKEKLSEDCPITDVKLVNVDDLDKLK